MSEVRSRIFNRTETFSVDNLLDKIKQPLIQIKTKPDASVIQLYKSEDDYINFLAKSFERKALEKYPDYKTDLEQFRHLIPDYENLNAYQREAYTLDTYLHWKLELEELKIRDAYNFSGTPLERAKQRVGFFDKLVAEDHHHDTRVMHHLKEKLKHILTGELEYQEFLQKYNETIEASLVDSIVEKRKKGFYFDIVKNKIELNTHLIDSKATGNKHKFESHVTPHDHIDPSHWHADPEKINEEKWKYAHLRKTHSTTNPWEDTDFPCDINLFGKKGEYPERFTDKDYAIEFVRLEEESDDNHFFTTERSTNIEYQFNLKRGIMNDKFFIGSVFMLFRKKEQFFTNLVVDYKNVAENLRSGFCGFTFFINGEWRNVTIDTNLPWYQADEMALSIATSNKTSFWLCLLQKAYSKLQRTYDVLNDVSVKNTLVDLTGGISKKITIKEKVDDSEKKYLFDEIRRCITQKYLVGSMKFDLSVENVKLLLSKVIF